jgi:hypothetical protein
MRKSAKRFSARIPLKLLRLTRRVGGLGAENPNDRNDLLTKVAANLAYGRGPDRQYQQH